VNNKLKAIAFILINCTAFTISMSINKIISPAIPVFLKILVRMSFGLLFFSPIIFKNGWRIFISKNPSLQVLRIFLMTLAMGATYFTYTQLPFAIAISLGFTGPIFTAVLAYFILKDRLQVGQWIAIFVGYAGVCLIVQPQGAVNNAVYVALVGNIATALGLIYMKKLTQVDAGHTIVAIGTVGVIFITAIWSLVYWLVSIYGKSFIDITWVWPTWKDLQLLMAMGFLGTISQLSGVQALKYTSPSFLAPFEYSRLVIAIPIGLALGEALPGYRELVGALVVLASIIYSSWKGSC
jgi:drug/metabolite transporter (DMT)-like permease